MNQTQNKEKKYSFQILQFGEGNFLRAFVDWIIQKTNDKLDLNIGIVIVKPREKGSMIERLKKQDCKYHVILEGIKDGKPVREIQKIDCIKDAVNPYSEYQKYKKYFLNSKLKFIISNTTEAGITRLPNVNIFDEPPVSYPAKIVALLYERFKFFKGDSGKGLNIICCELIENNASVLKEIVLELANENKLPAEFIKWVNKSCSFCNSLVDRIVTGFPKDNIKNIQKELGVEDNLIVVGEYYHLWAIEGNEHIKEELPFYKAGLNVLLLNDLKDYRDKKVRVLNGAHTALVPIGLLSGYTTVKEAYENTDISVYINKLISDEVLPNISGDKEELKQFANGILERFLNPYIKHYLKSISLNSISKWITRDYPSLKDDYKSTGKLPKRITFSLASLLVLYSPENKIRFKANDTQELLDIMEKIYTCNDTVENKIVEILSNVEIWGDEIAKFSELHHAVAFYVQQILSFGIKETLKKLD